MVPRHGLATLSIRRFPGVPELRVDSVLALLALPAAGADACTAERPGASARFTMDQQGYLDAAARAMAAGGHADTVMAVYRHLVHELTELQLRTKGLSV